MITPMKVAQLIINRIYGTSQNSSRGSYCFFNQPCTLYSVQPISHFCLGYTARATTIPDGKYGRESKNETVEYAGFRLFIFRFSEEELKVN